MLTKTKPAAPKPSEALQRLCAAALAATAMADCLRPIVQAHEVQALAEHEYRIARSWVDKGLPNIQITVPSDAYQMEGADFARWDARVTDLNRAAGLKFDEDTCPLLVAEHIQIMAENAFMEAAGELRLPVNYKDLISLAHRKQFLELTYKFVVPQVPQAMFDYYKKLAQQ